MNRNAMTDWLRKLAAAIGIYTEIAPVLTPEVLREAGLL